MDSQQISSEDLQYVLNHVFLPPKLPQCSEDDTIPNLGDIILCQLAYEAAREFCNHLSALQGSQWKTIVRMLKHLCDTISNFPKEELVRKFLALEDKDVLALHIRAQNAALVVRRTTSHVVFEAFEVSPSPQDVMAAEGKLICSYPGPAIEVPLDIAQNHFFVEQLVSFLNHMDVDQLDDARAKTTKAGSIVHETRDTTDPKYITDLLIAILHGIGKEADVGRITKRIADDVCWSNAKNPWRRSPLWLIIRVAVQTTCESREIYKAWMLFFHARLLQMFLEHDFSSDLLHTARVKTSRRAYKLQASAPSSLLGFVEIVVQAVQQKLSGRWSEEQRLQAHSPPFILDHSLFRDHTRLSLNHSREYLAKVLLPNVHSDMPATFTPSHHPRLRGRDISSIYPNALTQAVVNDPYVALADFERLVQDQSLIWTSNHIHDPTASKILGSCIEQYISATKKLYESSPEDQSLMLLTILDLWVALDTIVCSQIPLLRSYSPEIPTSVVEPLLLRSATLLERAARIQHYLSFRHSNADRAATPIFSAQITPSTFSVRYFEQSSSLQSIKSSIEQDASAKRAAKCAELHDLNEEHARLMREYDSRNCEYYTGTTRWGDTYTTHDRYCSRCRLLNQANRMRIDVHEWPLPNGTRDAEATVFELNCPTAFAIWRDRTYQILRDIGMVHIDGQSTDAYTLEGYAELGRWMKNDTTMRIIFASQAKSFRASHYNDHTIPAVNDRVCVNNGFKFTMYDKATSEFAHSEFRVNVDSYCTLPLPDGLYHHLKHAVAHSTHTHNSTIIEQANCPKNLSIHEQLAFSNLRCGSQLQWINIVRELRTQILTFSSDEVHTLLTQAAWQIGPMSGDGSVRLWHTELALPDFSSVLITEATELLSHVEGNWMEGNTVKTIIYLITRLLASATDSKVQERAYLLLRSARKTTHRWMREILRKLQDIVDDDIVRGELQRRACEMAATCRATFDVDTFHLNALLSSPTDVAVLIECAIVIHDNTPPNLGNTFPDFQKLLRRDRRLSHFLESALIEHVNTDRRGMDEALVDSVWPSYRQGDSGWCQLPEPNSRWMKTSTASQCNQRTQHVHYNTLDGTLLIDGRPLGRLPKEIVGHPTYARIFCQKFFDVIPADMPGMDYATRFLVHGYQLFFAFRDGAPIIRAQILSGQTIELIPHYIFDEDLPSLFCSRYVHWMAVSGDHYGEIEFRPLDDDHIQIWQQSNQNWRLEFCPNGLSHMFHGNGRTQMLIDIRSKTFKSIAAQLSPVEYPKFLTLFVNLDHQLISAELPRLRLSFFLNKDDALESNNLQSMVIDNDQCMGTMIGLRSQLVLRHKEPNFASLPRSRIALIPHGEVQYSLPLGANHVRIHINTRSQKQVVWYKYEIDTDLGILVGNVNLTSRLFRIYLHALSSHPLPDPLTHQRGTDLALQELDSAGSFSFKQLTNNDVELLRLIGKISPKREYYPKHLRVMQTTAWSPLLPVLSQHGTFDTAVAKIMQHAASLTIFPELQVHNKEVEYTCCGDPLLMARATRRSAIYYELPIESSSDSDKKYYARDYSRNNLGAVEALKTSQLICAWPVGFTGVRTTSGLLETFKSWGSMTGVQADPNTVLEYSKEWLHLDLPAKWFSLYVLCRQIDQPDSEKFKLLFSFAALAYSNDIDLLQQIPVLLAIASINPLLLDAPPQHPSYNLKCGFEPLRAQLFDSIRSKLYNLEESPAGQLCRLSGESPSAFKERVYKYYDATSKCKIDNAVDHLMNQWPSCDPHTPFQQSDSVEWFRFRDMDEVNEYFASCFHNSELRMFASQISSILVTHTASSPLTCQVIPNLQFSPRLEVARDVFSSSPTLRSLLSARSAPGPLPFSRQFGFKAIYKSHTRDCLVDGLEHLIIKFERNHCTTLQKQYCEQLRRSLEELRGQDIPVIPKEFTLPLASCIVYRQICQSRLADIFAALHAALAPFTLAEKVLETAGMWPLLSRRCILQQLASSVSRTYSEEWTKSLISFAEAYIEYQHSQRLVAFSICADINNFFKEVDNASFNKLDAMQNPDWLLIQIQGNFITRPIQSQVAREMISPSLGQNVALQLNMGEGKSHVIVPLVAAALANFQKLVRVVVLKPLARQMFLLLVERLSGLVNRRIFYLPFSRDVKATPQVVKSVKNLFEECVRVGGVLVVQPEHILSFRLMVIDRIISSAGPDLSQAARDLQATQNWLNSTSRDILDESDELLHIRYQLIYTIGQQQPVDDGPDRWITTQQIFDLMCQHMKQLQQEFPDDVELVEPHEATNEGQFPHFRLLGSAASQSLVSRIAEDALNGILENLTFVGLGSQPSLRTSVLHFITVKDISPEIYRSVAEIYETTGLWKGILLLRGLLAHGILVYVLSRRRYRVDFGLDPKRSLLAVPYRAKDVPSLRSEFGHPDVVVCLTCLSYYYEGLTPAQVRESFEILSKLDNPSLEYQNWVRIGSGDIPDVISELIGVNMKDIDAFTRNVIPSFRHNKATIDFYLSHVVFPKEAKEFPNKLGTSGWDLAESKVNFTTGFSGTNDNSSLLPTSITQTDPVKQLRTNAQVLEYLLRPENKRYVCWRRKIGEPCSAAELLEKMVHETEEIRVLLDVGAQMLEMTNQQLIKHWLSLVSSQDIKAGIFFDDSDTLSVITRNGSVELLHSSPFFQRLDQCIVYLDDAHTRGTDLRLPRDFRALVTLGPKVTKDKLVQGCMRMRSLGHGQSVVFCAPPEVDRHIRKLEGVEPSASVHVADVLSWAMANTCSDIEDHVSHWVQQGVYYHKRREGNLAFIASQETDIGLLKTSWLEPAAQTLDEMYGITTARSSMMDMVEGIPAMQDRLKQLGLMEASSEAIDEEQEREVSHELEEEAQLERPPAIPAAKHRLDEEVRMFVRHGTLQPESRTFMPLLTPLRSASETLTPPNPWTKRLLCTRDFMTTTTSGNERTLLTEYLRPVHWIVSHIRQDGDMLLVVMSPYETNALLEDIRHSKHVRLHVYAPRTSESMKPFDLSFYCIPPLDHRSAGRTSLTNNIGYQLNIWAGQLYFDSYQAYLDICLLLGISSSESEAESLVESDRFVPPGGRSEKMSAVCLFDKSPLPLLKILFGLRRKGMSFQSTHMGKLLQARLLLPKHFDENA